MKRIFILWSLLIIILSGTQIGLAQGDDEMDDIQNELTYTICDWGLLIVETPVNPDQYINILSPAPYSAVEGNSFTLEGDGQGLFESNVVVEITDESGEVLLQEPTILDTMEMGGMGSWELDVSLPEITETTEINIRAYSTSPRDGEIIALDSIQLNLNSEFGLLFIEIDTPIYSNGVSTQPLLIEGRAGGVFEGTVNLQVIQSDTQEMLVETFATVQSGDVLWTGPWSAEVELDVPPGTPLEIYAFQPNYGDEGGIAVEDRTFVVSNPLARQYERIFVTQDFDPLLQDDDVCSAVLAEFDNEEFQPITVNSAETIMTMSTVPNLTLLIESAGPSICPIPVRSRVTNIDGDVTVQSYNPALDEPVACTRDLRPFQIMVPLGQFEDPAIDLTINGIENP